MRSIPAEKIMKKPIPEEHVVLKNTFDGIIQKCLAVATDPVSLTEDQKLNSSLASTKGFIGCVIVLSFGLFTANQEEARRRQQTSGGALRQTQRADGEL